MNIFKLEVCDVTSLCYESLQVGSLLHRTHTCFESLCCEKFVSWKIGLFDIGQPLLTYFNLYAPTRLVFLILVSHCWQTLTCALPLVLSF